MKCFIFVLLSVYSVVLFGNGYRACELYYKDGHIRFGSAMVPNMNDKIIYFKSKANPDVERLSSDSLEKIVFTAEGGPTFKRVRTYKNYGNKKINKSDSWLTLLESGCLEAYSGFQTNPNTPPMELWYYRKRGDEVAYFISMKYSGGMVMTLGNKSTFKNNASNYLQDYSELTQDILNKKYDDGDLIEVATKYNEWCHD